LASTGSGRRALLKAALLAPVAALAGRGALATDYAAPAEVFDAIDGLEADVAAHLRALRSASAASARLVASVLADHSRHRAARERLRRRLGLAAAAGAPGSRPPAAPDLEALRAAQEALVYAHAEGLPAVADPFVVDALARHMVELSRHLTVTQLWIEAGS
jgi:hypothetical protein